MKNITIKYFLSYIISMKPEHYFFRYAFPCAQVLLDQHKIDQKAYDEMKRMFLADEYPSKQDLEQIFVSAFRRLEILAKEMNKDKWDIEVIKRYFHEDHNHFIDEGEGDYSKFGEDFKKICKVYTAEVIDREGFVLTVKIGDEISKVLGNALPEAKKGDKVKVHLGFAVELL